jgi:hypothetical protein
MEPKSAKKLQLIPLSNTRKEVDEWPYKSTENCNSGTSLLNYMEKS